MDTITSTTYGHGTGPRAQQALRDGWERERLANDLARWAGGEALAEHLETIATGDSYGVPFRHYTHCCDQAQEDAARNMYAGAMEMPLDVLRRRHASTLAERGGAS